MLPDHHAQVIVIPRVVDGPAEFTRVRGELRVVGGLLAEEEVGVVPALLCEEEFVMPDSTICSKLSTLRRLL